MPTVKVYGVSRHAESAKICRQAQAVYVADDDASTDGPGWIAGRD
jgi:hypothetical protein